jgi:cell wall-associated NlpC family hydrolase
MKKSIVFVLFLVITSFVSFAAESFPDSTRTDTCLQKHMGMIDSVITYAKNYIGVPYKYGGKGPQGFDCSGFVHFVFEPWGYNLPYSSKGYGDYGQEIELSEARPGDFALFRGRSSSSTGIGHVALVIDVDESGEVYIIHATIHKGITIDNMSNQDYYVKRYLQVRRMPVPCDISEPVIE